MAEANRISIGQVTIREERVVQFGRSLNGGPGVTVKALSTNAGSVYLGESREVTERTGYELIPGEGISADLLNPSIMWIFSANPGDKICFLGLNP